MSANIVLMMTYMTYQVYGAAVGFYEEYQEEDLTDTQMRTLGLKNKSIREKYRIQKTVHVRKSISLLSHWPFFDAFKKFLSQLYKVSITGPHQVMRIQYIPIPTLLTYTPLIHIVNTPYTTHLK